MNKYFCTNRNNNYRNEVEQILTSRKQGILDFFNVMDDGQFNFNIFIYDTIGDLVNEMKNRGFAKMPDYMCACYKDEDNSLNFFEPKDNPNENEWSKEEYRDVVFHEEIQDYPFMSYELMINKYKLKSYYEIIFTFIITLFILIFHP